MKGKNSHKSPNHKKNLGFWNIFKIYANRIILKRIRISLRMTTNNKRESIVLDHITTLSLIVDNTPS